MRLRLPALGGLLLAALIPVVQADPAVAATPTVVTHVSPVDASSQLADGWTVTKTVASASCVAGSDTVRHVYSCVAPAGFYTPCWYEAKGSSPHALCMTGPFSHKVVRITKASGLKHPKTDSGAPRVWGIRTTSELDCTEAVGATISFQGRRISYFCGHNVALLGSLNRSRPQWTVHGAHYDFSRGIAFTRPTTYKVLTAVIGDPSLGPPS